MMEAKDNSRYAQEVNDIYRPASWLAKIKAINQIILGTNVLISVLCEHGGGKTSFCHLLQAGIDPLIKSYYVAANSLFDEKELMVNFSRFMDFSDEKKLEEIALYCQKNKVHRLLIIDDAHLLPESFIEKILKVLTTHGEQSYLHFCLVANTQFMKSLAAFEKGEFKEMLHAIELGHLSEKETKEYLVHRILSQPGFVAANKAKQLYQHTDGSIVGVNTQMASFFQPGNLSSKVNNGRKTLSNNHHRFAVIIGAAAVALGVAFVMKPTPSGLGQSNTVLAQIETPENANEKHTIDEAYYISSIPSYNLAAVRQFMQTTDLRRAEYIISNEEGQDSDAMVVMDRVVVAPKVITKLPAPQENSNKAIKKSFSKSQLAHNNLKETEQHIVAEQHSIRPLKKSFGKHTQHKLNPYAIQLIASHNPAELERFAKSHELTDKTKIYQFDKHGQKWFILTLGDYQNHMLAKQALSKLPEKMTQYKPWVRNVEQLKPIA